jgi:ribosomal protein S18 acetylase RimI-like enzyme
MIEWMEASHEDDEFLYKVYESTRVDEFAALGWSEQQLEALLRMQFEAQRKSYGDQFPAAKQRIIVYKDNKVGHMITAYKDESLVLVYVALLPEYRNRGIGTRLIQDLQREAMERDMPLRLHVLPHSAASRLYERLGFSAVDEGVPYVAMEWNTK